MCNGDMELEEKVIEILKVLRFHVVDRDLYEQQMFDVLHHSIFGDAAKIFGYCLLNHRYSLDRIQELKRIMLNNHKNDDVKYNVDKYLPLIDKFIGCIEEP